MVVGVLFAFIVSRFIWPNLARSRLRRKMAKTVLEMGDLYSQIVANFVKKNFDEISTKKCIKMEAALQFRIIKLRMLVGLALLEPRIKVTFPRNFLTWNV